LRTGNLDNGIACRADDHCKSGLCDRGVCTDIEGGHGESCEQLPPMKQRVSRLEDPCGAYICLDGRCRSCTSDAECVYWKGGGTCDYVPGAGGKRCGRHMPLDPDGPYKTPPPLSPLRLPSGAVYTLDRPTDCPRCPSEAEACPAPATSAKPTPVPCGKDLDCSSRVCDGGICGPLRTGNLENGSACRADDHCQSGLCDRGVCTFIGGKRNQGHGEPCEQGPPVAKQSKDGRPHDQCGAYICLDGRCRSCTSDSECIDSKGGGTCEHVPGLPGKHCGNHKPLDPNVPKKTPPP
jgi:hypothetical protein